MEAYKIVKKPCISMDAGFWIDELNGFPKAFVNFSLETVGINGILKQEFGLNKTIPNLNTAQKMVKQAIEIYNNERRHCSLGMKTPEFAHVNQFHKYKSYKKNKIPILVA